MMDKQARAKVTPVRQRTQYTCMSTSMMMCLQANGVDCTEDEVNRVMGAKPMQGASWEDAGACAQHYGMRATLTMPATVGQLREWTDRGVPVMIAWNPEGRDWSHASVVFDVEDRHDGRYIHVADPNMPNPNKVVRVIHEDDFYSKWSEKWPRYLVRRPAMAIEREITPEGRQVMASQHVTASTGGDEIYFPGTDGNWYLELYTPPWDEDNEWDDGTRNYYGPFPSLQAARDYRKRNHSNPGSETVSRQKRRPPYNPISPRRSRRASGRTVRDNSGREWSPRRGLEGPFLFRGGRVLYYDPRENGGTYYDPATDMYLPHDEALRITRSAGAINEPYEGNPDGDPIYENAVPHGYEQPLSGGWDIMKRLQDKLLIEQGKPPREPNPRLASNEPWMNMPTGVPTQEPLVALPEGEPGVPSLIQPQRLQGQVDPEAAGSFWWCNKDQAEVWRNKHHRDRFVMAPNQGGMYILVPPVEVGMWGGKGWQVVSQPQNPRLATSRDTQFRGENSMDLTRESMDKAMHRLAQLDQRAALTEEKEARFPKGKSTDPTKNMTPEQKAEWKAQNEAHRDKFKSAADYEASLELLSRLAGDEDDDEGVQAGCAKGDTGCDPTEHMSPEDKAKWEAENEAHKDQFKKKTSARRRLTKHHQASPTVDMWAAVYGDGALFGATNNPSGATERFWGRVASEEDFAIYKLSRVPMDLAKRLSNQGTQEQSFSDGYQAWDAAKHYARGVSPMHMASELVTQWNARTAGRPAGLYGFTKKTQRDVEASIRKLTRAASKVARAAYKKDERVAPFLSAHAQRSESNAAHILVAALKDMGPKVAAKMGSGGHPNHLANDRVGNQRASGKAASYSMYGYRTKTATLGLNACAAIKTEAGRIAADLHRRRANQHDRITGFLDAHSDNASCRYSKMLRRAYPDSDVRLASVQEPQGVEGWLSWDD